VTTARTSSVGPLELCNQLTWHMGGLLGKKSVLVSPVMRYVPFSQQFSDTISQLGPSLKMFSSQKEFEYRSGGDVAGGSIILKRMDLRL
jgi:hypothetical protein